MKSLLPQQSLVSHKLAAAALLVAAASHIASAALVTDPNDPRNWQGATVGTFAALYYGSDTLANRQLVVDNHLLDDGLFDFTGATAATLLANGWSLGGVSTGTSLDNTGTGSYGYIQPSALGTFGAANSIDEHWIQTSGTIGQTVFDLGGLAPKAVVFNTIDHGPLPQEAIESTVYLSADQVSWTPAVVERVWLEGFESNLGILWDGFAYAVGTGTSDTFRYASVVHGGPGALLDDGDNEINGILGVDANFRPTVPDSGSSLMMTAIALIVLGGVARLKKA